MLFPHFSSQYYTNLSSNLYESIFYSSFRKISLGNEILILTSVEINSSLEQSTTRKDDSNLSSADNYSNLRPEYMHLLSRLGCRSPPITSSTVTNTTAFPDSMFSEQCYAKYFCFVVFSFVVFCLFVCLCGLFCSVETKEQTNWKGKKKEALRNHNIFPTRAKFCGSEAKLLLSKPSFLRTMVLL